MSRRETGGHRLSPEASAWRRRYRAAAGLLNDAAALVRLSHMVHELAGRAAPVALLLDGEERVRQAARVGVVAGSFNPLTCAHLALAEAARAAAGLDVVVWTMAALTVDKERVERASFVDRLAEMMAYVRGAQAARADALALTNRGLYVEEAAALRTHLTPQAELYLVVGYDKIVQIFDPRYYVDRTRALDTLFSLTRILVGPRGADRRDALAALLARPENAPYARHVRYVPLAPEYARDSSTEARELAAGGRGTEMRLRALVPPEALALVATEPYAGFAAYSLADRYQWRQRWLDALAQRTVPQPWPGMDELVRLSAQSDLSGEKVRAWLAAPRAEVLPASLRRLLETVR